MTTAPAKSKIEQVSFEETAKALAMSCHEVSYSIGGLPTSRRVSDTTKRMMTDVVNGKKQSYSVGKRLFSSKHPLLKDVRVCRTEIDAWRDAWTIVKSDSIEGADDKLRVAPGVRLIRNEDIPVFDDGFKVRIDNYYEAVNQVQEFMHADYTESNGKVWKSIYALEAEALGTEFNSADYPEDVRECVKSTIPDYQPYSVSIHLPKEIYERQERRLHDAMTKSIEVATTSLTDTMVKTFMTLANSLVNRARLYPRDKALSRYDQAAVIKTVTATQSAKLKPGQILVKIRCEPNPEDPDDEGPTEIGPIAEVEFQTKYRPMATDERKKITTSVVDNLMTQLRNFENVRTMLGAPGEQIHETLDQIRDILASAGSDAGTITAEIRNAQSFRTNLARTLEDVTEELFNTAQEVRQVRRRLSTKLMAKER